MVFKKTEKRYKAQHLDGLVYYNSINHEASRFLTLPSAILPNYKMTQFYTEDQAKYFTRQVTWAWTKCHLSAECCQRIIEETPLREHIEHYALITHDKDKDTVPHTHMLIKFYRNQWIHTNLVDYFHVDTVSNVADTVFNRVRYLTHDSDKCRKEGKYQYDVNEVLSDNFEWWLKIPQKAEDPNGTNDGSVCILDDIMRGVSSYELAKKYGKEFIYHRRHYLEIVDAIHAEKVRAVQQDFQTGYEIHSIGEGYLAIYDKATGNLLHVEKNLKGVYDKLCQDVN